MSRILCLSFFTFVLAMGCHRVGEPGVQLDSSFTGFLPAGTKALLGIRLDELKKSEFYKRHENQLNLAQISSFSERIGVDPRRDIDTIVVAWDGRQVLTMMRGGFKSDDVQQKISKLMPQQQSYRNLTLLGGPQETVVVLPRGMALAGPAGEVKASIDQSVAGGGHVPDEIQLRLRSVKAGAQIWAASAGVLPLTSIPMRSDMQSGISNLADYVDGTTLGVAIDAGVQLKADISCISPEGAERVNSALRGLIGFARLSTRDNELDLLRLWDAIHVEKTNSGVQVNADLPSDLAEKLISHLPGVSGRAGQLLQR